MGIFLGSFAVAFSKYKFITYEETKALAISAGIKSKTQYAVWKRPAGVPRVPANVYKNKGWISWGEFLETYNTKIFHFRPFADARDYIKKFNFKTQREFQKWSASKQRPKDIPSNPPRRYKEWKTWDDFLGTNNRKSRRAMMPFAIARAFVRKQKFKSMYEYKYSKWEKPSNFPERPRISYKHIWMGWNDFLGIEPGKRFDHLPEFVDEPENESIINREISPG